MQFIQLLDVGMYTKGYCRFKNISKNKELKKFVTENVKKMISHLKLMENLGSAI